MTGKRKYTEDEQKYLEEHPEAKGFTFTCDVKEIRRKMGEQQSYCQNCPGLDACEYGGRTFSLLISRFTREVIAGRPICNVTVEHDLAQKKEKEEREFQERGLKGGIPRRYIKCRLNQDYRVDDYNREAVTKTIAALKNRESIYLCGNVGTGKTMLASLLAMAAVREPRGVRFVNSASFLAQLRQSINDNSYSDKLDQVLNTGLLVLDDIGTERFTDWATEQIFIVLDHRYANEKQTVLTSNLTLEQLRAQINSITGDRICSRLKSYKIAFLGGDDRR